MADARRVDEPGIHVADVDARAVGDLGTQRFGETAQPEFACAVCGGEGAAEKPPSEIMLMNVPVPCLEKTGSTAWASFMCPIRLLRITCS